MKALSPELKAKAKAVIDGRSLKAKPNREALEALANEVNRPYVSRKGFAGRGENNFEVNGEIVDKKTTIGKLDDGIYMVKGGVCKKMKTRNKLGAVICVTYRTLPKKGKDEAPAPKATAKKAPAKKAEKIVAAKKAPAKKAPAKVTKKAPAGKGKTKGRR